MENTKVTVILQTFEEPPPIVALELLEEARKTGVVCHLVEISIKNDDEEESTTWGVVTEDDHDSDDISQFEWVYEKIIYKGEMVNVPVYKKEE